MTLVTAAILAAAFFGVAVYIACLLDDRKDLSSLKEIKRRKYER